MHIFHEKNGNYLEKIDDLSGLSKDKPLLSLSFLIIFSLAGILTCGFFAKFYVFMAVMRGNVFISNMGLLRQNISLLYLDQNHLF